jgi:hypothetical protein
MSESVRRSIRVTCQIPIGGGTSYQSLGILLEAADTTLTRREKVQEQTGQMEEAYWIGHLIDHDLVVHIELKKHTLHPRAERSLKEAQEGTDCQLGF